MNQPSASVTEQVAIKAPAERVFDALTDPQQRVKWWGAEGRFQTQRMESDLRPGGRWLMSGIGMGGRPFTIRGVYREIERPRLLSFTWIPSWQGSDLETLVRFDLNEKDGVTTVRLTHSGLTQDSRAQHRGWPDVLAWLREHVEKPAT
jgi:uncharacterized protein YndB with AHSA1/START domain